MSSDYVLLTGATGLLGRYLLRDLLLANRKVAVVVRPGRRVSARARIESIMQYWERELSTALPRPVCLIGDITRPDLGLDARSCRWVAEHCSSVLHSAASLAFQEEENGEPWKTNIEGTRNVLDFCHSSGITTLHYVSTAYVCGKREGRIYEDELNCGQEFRNVYERSKYQAEELVRSDPFVRKLTVYRPAVIAGDSQSGYTNTYHGLYMYLKIMCILARSIPPGPDGVRRTEMQLHLTGDEERNVIPVDWTSAVITHLFTDPQAHGQSFHLAPRVRMTARQMIEAGYSYFNSTGVEFIGPATEPELDGNDLKRHAYENSTLYRDYEYSDPVFDTSNLDRFAPQLPCPAIDEAMLHRYIQFGEIDHWGKRPARTRRSPSRIS